MGRSIKRGRKRIRRAKMPVRARSARQDTNPGEVTTLTHEQLAAYENVLLRRQGDEQDHKRLQWDNVAERSHWNDD